MKGNISVSVLEFGGVADGETLCTQAVQKAVDFCHENGGALCVLMGAGTC